MNKLIGLSVFSSYKLQSPVVCPEVSGAYWTLYCLSERERKCWHFP